MKNKSIALAVLALILAAACSDTHDSAAPDTPAASAAVAESLPSAAASPQPAPHPAATNPEHAASAPASDEKSIVTDEFGQWATAAEASTTYGDSTGKADYSAWQATGAPNVPHYADHPNAWTTKNGDSAMPEWLQLTFDTPVHATTVRIRQNAAPGAISRIELLDTGDASHVIWEGTDATPYAKDTIGWLKSEFPPTTYLVKGVRLTLVTNRVWGWNEIDAVQLVGRESESPASEPEARAGE